MNTSQDCPPREMFVDFLTGQLEEDPLKRMEAHLAACSACGDTVRALNVEDTFVQLKGVAPNAIYFDTIGGEFVSAEVP